MLVIILIFGRCISEVVFWIFERRLRPGWLSLKDLSVTAQQIDLRLQQTCYWPIQYMTLRKRRRDWASITINHPDYIRYYNSLWLVANDIIMGVAFGTYLIENNEEVAKVITWVGQTCLVEGLGRLISWLREWPAGLKLNTELAAFLAELFTYLIEFWAGKFPKCDSYDRVCHSASTAFSTNRYCGRILGVHRNVIVNFPPIGYPFPSHNAHLLVLHCVCSDLRLATLYLNFPIPPVSW